MPYGRKFCPTAKNIWNIYFGVRISAFPNEWGKKTNLYGHPKMCSEKFPKTTMLHICRLELKKVAVKNIKWLT